MPIIIKNNKFDNIVDKLIYYFYFAFQFFFVFSGTALMRSNDKAYKVAQALIIIPFLMLALCDFYYFLRGKFSYKEITIYILIGIVLVLSFFNYRNVMVLANLVAISAFKDADGKKALKYYIYATTSAFVIALLLGIFTPFKGNIVQARAGGIERTRYGLGFFYASLGQFYFLSIVLAYILIKEKLKLTESFIFILISAILFYFTDTKAPFAYSVFAVVLFLIIDKLKETRIFDLFSCISILSPFIACIGMFFMSFFYSNNNKVLSMINHIVSGRLELTHNAIMRFGVKIFGQTAPEVLGDPTCYLDSSLMVLLVLFGLMVTIISLCFMSFFAYLSYKNKKVAILVVIFFISLRGAFDLGFMAIQFSPVVLLFMPAVKQFFAKDYSYRLQN